MTAGIKVRANPADMKRITDALKQCKSIIKAAAPKYRWTLNILDSYEKVVASAMGSVRGTGGSVHLSYRGVSKNKYWQPLTDATAEAYKLDKAVLSIWKYTGKTQEAVHTESAAYGGFAGIDSAEAVATATAMEEGGDPVNRHPNYGGPDRAAYPRPLFSIANSLFETAISNALNNPNSSMYQELCADVINSILPAWTKA